MPMTLFEQLASWPNLAINPQRHFSANWLERSALNGGTQEYDLSDERLTLQAASFHSRRNNER